MSFARVWLLVWLCGLTFFVGLGRPAIADSDEAFYAQAAREMVERGDWVTPYYNGRYRFEKPVLYYWLVAIAYRIAGVGELAARLPSALAGLLLVLTTYACARRWYDGPTAGLAGAITATSFGYVAVARQALPDLTLACFITIATWGALVAMVAPRPPGRDPGRRRWLVLAGLALAGAVLTKGPVGVALPAIVVGPLALWRGYADSHASGGTTAASTRRLAGDVLVLATVCLVVAAPWFAAMTATHGIAYLDRFFIGENLQRFATDRYNAPRSVWYYLPIVVGGLLPWSPLMVLWWRPLRRVVARARRLQAVEIWLGLWALTPLLFYSISIGKQPRYILPVLPPLAILVARALARALERRGHDRLLAVGGLTSAVTLALLGLLIARAQVLLPGVSAGTVLAAAALTVVSAAGVAFASVSHQRRLPLALVVAAVVSTLAVQYVLLSRAGEEPVQRMAALVRSAGPETVPYGRYRAFVRNLLFYTGRPHVDLASDAQVTAFLQSSEPVLCVIGEPDLERARAEGVTVRELGRVTYLNTGGLTLRTLVRPDPDLDLRTIVLVTNRTPP